MSQTLLADTMGKLEMDNWKLTNLKTKLAALGIKPIGAGEYLDQGTGEILQEGDLQDLYGDSGLPQQTAKIDLQVKTHKITAKCYRCGLGIAFKKLNNGKFAPINENGISHQCRRK